MPRLWSFHVCPRWCMMGHAIVVVRLREVWTRYCRRSSVHRVEKRAVSSSSFITTFLPSNTFSTRLSSNVPSLPANDAERVAFTSSSSSLPSPPASSRSRSTTSFNAAFSSQSWMEPWFWGKDRFQRRLFRTMSLSRMSRARAAFTKKRIDNCASSFHIVPVGRNTTERSWIQSR